MIRTVSFSCPSCYAVLPAPFTGSCPNCGFNDGHLLGVQLTQFQARKLNEHTQLLTGNTISLYGKQYNASFDFHGNQSLQDLVRFTITFGTRAVIPSNRGNHINPAIIAYVPDIIGSGLTAYSTGLYACSGICIMSPQSYNYGHPFPVLDGWVQTTFGNIQIQCTVCGAPTQFGFPFCASCHAIYGSDWRKLLRPPSSP